MNKMFPSRRAHRAFAVAAAIGFIAIALFQVALAAGAPLGHAAWGGGNAHLSSAQRIGSATAVFVWSAATLIVTGRAGIWGTNRRSLTGVFHWGTWFFAVVTAIGAVMNFASRSRWENLIFGPLALVLAILCTLVARRANQDSEQTDQA